jgi:hypothetical protein
MRVSGRHLKGDANLLVASVADHVITVEFGKVEIVTREQVQRHLRSSADDSLTTPQIRGQAAR